MPSSIELEVVVTNKNFDEKLYLKSNPDVKLAVESGKINSGKSHFNWHGKREGRKLRKEEHSLLNKMRSAKLEKIEKLLRTDMQRNDEFGIPSYLSSELRQLARISETENVSSHQYDKFGLDLINANEFGLVLDCGAGRRPVYYENVVNFEIAPYDTTDVLGVGEKLPFKDGSFDAVISIAVLEHVQDPFICAKEIGRVLKPGGKLYCAIPFLQPYHGYPHHYFNATHQGISRLFEDDLIVDKVFVPQSNHPIMTLSWIIKSWASGLAQPERQKFLSMNIGDFLGDPKKFLGDDFCANLPPNKISELACANSLLATKPL